MRFYLPLLALLLSIQLNAQEQKFPYLYVLGTLQDGGMPHIGCEQEACKKLIARPNPSLKVVSLGLIDPLNKSTCLFEATPDMDQQLYLLKEQSGSNNIIPNGVFITHAHIGHYAGLMYLGKEAKGAQNASVFSMPKMTSFLKNNAPWNLLVENENIILKNLSADQSISLTNQLKVIPILVPHRDELSETVGYKIIGPSKTALFIPDINKWSLWNKSITAEIQSVDYAFIDATFYDNTEINYRNLSEIPHPFVIESMETFRSLSTNDKNKIYFIHLNHSNPLVDPNSKASMEVESHGYHIARFKMKFGL